MKIQIQAPAEDSEVFIVDQALSKLFNGNLERAVSSIGAWFAGISAILDIPLPELNEVVGGQYEKGRITRAALLKHAQEAGIAGLPPLPNWAAPASSETTAPATQNGHSAAPASPEAPPEAPASQPEPPEAAPETETATNGESASGDSAEDSGAVQEPVEPSEEVTAVGVPETKRKAVPRKKK